MVLYLQLYNHVRQNYCFEIYPAELQFSAIEEIHMSVEELWLYLIDIYFHLQ